MSKPLTKIKFHSIARDIRDGRRTVAEMAEFHHVSAPTIRTVRRTKTWPGFVLHKQQRTSYIANAKDRKFHDAQKAGLKPVKRELPIASETEAKELQDSLDQLGQLVTRDEFESAIHLLNERMDVHAFTIKQKADKKQRWWSRH